MARYLDSASLKTNLRLGKSVEQWLPHQQLPDYTVLRYIVITGQDDDAYDVAYIESFDDGDENFFDVYSFSTLDPDEPGGVVNTFESVADAIEFAVNTYQASPDKFVNQGTIQEEYLDYLKTRNR